MKYYNIITLSVIYLLLISVINHAQVVNIPILVTDGTSNGKDTLRFGLDPSATDGIDAHLGEAELPPVPPSGIFDIRFVGTNLNPPLQLGQGIKRDYRTGSANYVGIKTHQIKFQRSNSNNNIIINYSLPAGVTGRIFDLFGGIVLNDSITGSGSVTITNTGISTVLMRINYNLGSIGINNNTNLVSDNIVLCNYPNPFNSVTKIKYQLSVKGFVKITLLDMLGRELVTLLNKQQEPGYYALDFNASELSSGIYFCKYESSSYIKINKLVLVK